jgi:hypothetical protein
LAEVQPRGGPGEAAGVDDRGEGAQVVELHRCTRRIDYKVKNALDTSGPGAAHWAESRRRALEARRREEPS